MLPDETLPHHGGGGVCRWLAVYAAYGGVFIVLSLLWGWLVDGWRPDRYDLLGAAVALIGVAISMWGRRWV